MSLLESTMVAYGRRTVFDSLGAKADLELWSALNDAVDMLAEDHRWPWFIRKGNINTVTPYSTGTITVTAASTTITGSGTVWPSWAASGTLKVGNKLYGIATRTSDTVLVLDNAFGGDTAAAQSYILFQDEYALPANLFQFKQVLPGQAWGAMPHSVPIEDLWAVQNATIIGQQYPDLIAVSNGNLTVFPYPSENNSILYSYYARPTPLTGSGSAAVDWPDAHRTLLNRAYDFHLCLRFGKTVMGDVKTCLELYNQQLARSKPNDQSPRDIPGMMDLRDGARSQVPEWKRRA